MSKINRLNEITKILNEYRNAKLFEKDITANLKNLKDKLIGELNEDDKKVVTSFFNNYETQEEEMNGLKKSNKEALSNYTNEIKDILLDESKSLKEDVHKDEIDLSHFAKLEWEYDKNLTCVLTKEQRKELVLDLIDEGMEDLLTIDEEAYVKASRENFREIGRHLKGVVENPTVKTKITIRK